jgi:hypothetical protein
MRFAYTYSRSIDNTPQELESNSGSAPNGYNYTSWTGPSDFDTPHRVVASYVWELPFGRGRRFVHDGILSHIIGGYVDCWFFASNDKIGTRTPCLDLAPGLSDAYQLQSAGFLGNVGRNTLRGPHTSVFDFAFMRDFPIHESLGLQFRWEVFNLANAILLGQPSTNISSSSVGQITSLSGDPRVMQFALRLSF